MCMGQGGAKLPGSGFDTGSPAGLNYTGNPASGGSSAPSMSAPSAPSAASSSITTMGQNDTPLPRIKPIIPQGPGVSDAEFKSSMQEYGAYEARRKRKLITDDTSSANTIG